MLDRKSPERLTLEEYGCFLAFSASLRSEDEQTKVGAVLFGENKEVLSTGFNGYAKSMSPPPEFALEENRARKAKLIFHAEQNLIRLKKEGKPLLLCLTHTPCESCAKLIAAQGIPKVCFLNPYIRGTEDYKEIFDFYNIKYERLSKESFDKIKSMIDKRFIYE